MDTKESPVVKIIARDHTFDAVIRELYAKRVSVSRQEAPSKSALETPPQRKF